MTTAHIDSLDALRDRIGSEVAVSDWVEIAQERIDAFAAVTDDAQWIHVDPERAARESPYETTVAHGFLTLSLVASMAIRSLAIDGVAMVVNYGLDRVRFVSAVPAGSKVRGRFSLAALDQVKDGGVQATWAVTVERDGGEKPCCVAEWLVRYYVRDQR